MIQLIFQLIVVLSFAPFVAIVSQYMWYWSMHDIRDHNWHRKTWMNKLSRIFNTHDFFNLSAGLLVFPTAIVLATGGLIYLIYFMIADAPLFLQIVVGILLFLFTGPGVTWLLRTSARKREQMMSRLGQEETL